MCQNWPKLKNVIFIKIHHFITPSKTEMLNKEKLLSNLECSKSVFIQDIHTKDRSQITVCGFSHSEVKFWNQNEHLCLGSRRWNWKFREKHFWNPNPELLLHYRLSKSAIMKKCEKYKKCFSREVRDSDFKKCFSRNFQFHRRDPTCAL